ncbi:MAG TPA: tetratricopeptide repeat protein [Saprospiraceae bacterium]|nr:tetratricopeptide repeat protein [Saprospiraceae bacterium]
MKNTQKPFIAILLLVSSLQVAGQADSILAMPMDVQKEALHSWYDEKETKDSTWFLMRIDQMYKDFMQAGREDLASTAWSIRISFQVYNMPSTESRTIDIIDQALAHAIRMGWKVQEAELYINKGWTLRNYGRLVIGFENLMKGYDMMRQIGFVQFPRGYTLLFRIGHAYYFVKAYDQADIYISQALETPMYEPGPETTTIEYNMLGLCYMKQMKYDSAIINFQKAHDAAVDAKMDAYVGLTLGNIGYCHFKLGHDSTALPLLEEDFRVSVEMKEFTSAMNASLALSAIYLKKGMLEKAEYHMRFASQHVNRGDNSAMKSYFDNLSDLRRIAGDYNSALAYRDSASHYLVRMQDTEEKDILQRARLELEIEKHANELSSLETQRKRQILLRNVVLLFTVLIGIILVAIIQRRYLQRKRQLAQARKDLTMFTESIREKNEMLDTFSHEIDLLRATDLLKQDERTHHLTELINSHILTEDDWNRFRMLFDKVHPGFFVRLKEKIPDLTAAETRLLALTKLQLAPREMASMLGISYDSILKTRQRLRKKINLPEEGSLDELLKLI